MNSKAEGTDFWMEIKIILDPRDYHELRRRAMLEGLNTSEFVKQLVRQTLEENNSANDSVEKEEAEDA